MRFFWIIVVICLTTSASAQVNIGYGGEAHDANQPVASAELLIQGNVMITQGPTSIAGDGLSGDLETGSGTITGRVRTVLESSDP